MPGKRIHGMILAAGLGTRLRPLTDKIPKPAVLVAGKPLIHYALENMAKAGVDRVVINTHYLAEQIIATVAKRHWPFEIRFVHEPEILGTGGAIRNARTHLEGADAFLIHNGDAIIECNFPNLVETHFAQNPLATMVLKTVSNPEAFGVVVSDAQGHVRDIVGKLNYSGKVERRRMFCGVYVLDSTIFERMPQQGAFCILRDVLIPALAAGAHIHSIENAGHLYDVGTIERLREAEQELSSSR